ncbi:hypothetical protein [Burkholderia gladioli]|uniref:hypothetical protein n=1 Tax=Burkholderia gladioli TaxID=28095 RepID=UPI0016400C7A|nr:hypothetical protein [Burkholderia gladioli]
MRTADPQNIKVDFLRGLQDVEDALDAVTASTVTQKSRNLIAEYSFLGAAVLLEGFVSDLFVACINKDSSRFVGAMAGLMTMTATDDTAKRAIAFAEIDISTHLTLDKIRKILDPKGWNVGFNDSADLKAKAGQWLENPFRARFTGLSQAHSAVFDATKSVRNFLAHRSSASLATMQAALASPTLPAGFRRAANKVHSVGSFLDSVPPGAAQIRIKSYLLEVRAIAEHLWP